jgi:hypothetical protein
VIFAPCGLAWILIAAIEILRDATKTLRGGDAMLMLAKDLRSSTEVLNAIQHGRLLTIAKLGELIPAKQGERTDLTSPNDWEKLGINKNTETAYRKVAKSVDKIDAYYADINEDDETSMAGFIRWNTDKARG